MYLYIFFEQPLLKFQKVNATLPCYSFIKGIVSAKENFSSIEQRNDLIESILYLESEKDRIAYIFGKISDADDTSCNEMLSGCTEGSQTIIRKFQDNTPDFRCLLGKHFVRHNPDKFFFDETINCFMLLLSTLDSKLCASDASRIQSYFFSSEFIDNKVVAILIIICIF